MMIQWIRTDRLSIKNSPSLSCHKVFRPSVSPRVHSQTLAVPTKHDWMVTVAASSAVHVHMCVYLRGKVRVRGRWRETKREMEREIKGT